MLSYITHASANKITSAEVNANGTKDNLRELITEHQYRNAELSEHLHYL